MNDNTVISTSSTMLTKPGDKYLHGFSLHRIGGKYSLLRYGKLVIDGSWEKVSEYIDGEIMTVMRMGSKSKEQAQYCHALLELLKLKGYRNH
jgi:hypothetical protein